MRSSEQFADAALAVPLAEPRCGLRHRALPHRLRAGVPLRRVLPLAFVLALPLNRWLLAPGRGHAVVHEYR